MVRTQDVGSRHDELQRVVDDFENRFYQARPGQATIIMWGRLMKEDESMQQPEEGPATQHMCNQEMD